MNTLSKVLAVFCVLLSASAFAYWDIIGADGEASAKASGAVALTASADGRTVYYAHSGKLFKSTNGGESWALLK